MEENEILENTKIVARFMGYEYYKRVLIDFLDCGGIYEWANVFSKIPIEVEDYPEDEQCFFKGNFPGENWDKLIYNPKYHKSWDLLMPVIEKIGEIKFPDDVYPCTNTRIYIERCYPRTFGMKNEEGNFMFRFNGHRVFNSETLIIAAYKAVIEFIKFHNENK